MRNNDRRRHAVSDDEGNGGTRVEGGGSRERADGRRRRGVGRKDVAAGTRTEDPFRFSYKRIVVVVVVGGGG